MKHLKKKEGGHLKIFFAFSCKWKHLLKSSSMKSSHISKKKKKILLYTCSHNYAEINGKLKKKAPM